MKKVTKTTKAKNKSNRLFLRVESTSDGIKSISDIVNNSVDYRIYLKLDDAIKAFTQANQEYIIEVEIKSIKTDVIDDKIELKEVII